MAYLLGIDVGTTGTKTLLIDEDGGVIASATIEYPMYTPRPQWAEQDP
jgi:xylulokinase